MTRLASRWLAAVLRATRTIFVVALLGTMALWMSSRTGGGAAPTWRYVAATRSDAGTSKSIELWHRDLDAVLVERDQAGNVDEKRCVDGTLSEHWSTGRVVRQLVDREECFRSATNSLLGFTRTAQSAAFQFVGRRDGNGYGRTAYDSRDSTTPVKQIILDADTHLPLEARFQSGETWTWAYLRIVERNEAPPSPDQIASNLPTETYTDLTREQAAARLGLEVVPTELLGRQLHELFAYEPSERSSSVYAIWGSIENPDVSPEVSNQIQLVVTAQAPPSGELGFEDLGGMVVMRLREGESQVLISAPDKVSLAAALRALRPGVEPPALLSSDR